MYSYTLGIPLTNIYPLYILFQIHNTPTVYTRHWISYHIGGVSNNAGNIICLRIWFDDGFTTTNSFCVVFSYSPSLLLAHVHPHLFPMPFHFTKPATTSTAQSTVKGRSPPSPILLLLMLLLNQKRIASRFFHLRGKCGNGTK